MYPDFNYLRRNSLFDQPQQSVGINPNALQITPQMQQDNPATDGPATQMPNSLSQPNPTPNLADIYRQMSTMPSGPSNQRYKDFLANEAIPERSNFPATKMQRLGAVLSGVAAGAQGKNGYGAAQDVLDQPYNEAALDYKNKAARLSEGAALEDKEQNNAVKTYRDFVTDQHNRGLESVANTREQRLTDQGNAKTDVDWAKVNKLETPEQRRQRALDTTGAAASGRLNFFNQTEPIRQKNRLATVAARGAEARQTQTEKFEDIKELKQYVADNINKDKYTFRVDKDGMLEGVNNTDPSDIITTKIDTGKMNDKDKLEFGLKARKEVKQTAAPGSKKTSTTTVDGNKRTTTTETTPNGPVEKVDVIGPNGEQGKMNKTEFEEAKKHGWKLKGGV